MIMQHKNILGLLNKHKSAIRAFGVREIGLFGSFAKKANHSGSDVDVLVEFVPGQKTFDHFMDLKFFLRKHLGREIDLVIKGSIKPLIRRQVLKDVIYASL